MTRRSPTCTLCRDDGAHPRAWSAGGDAGRGAPEATRGSRPASRVGILFGPERTGLLNDEVALADRIITYPVNPGFCLAQPGAGRAADGLRMVRKPATRARCRSRCRGTLGSRASQHQMQAFFDNLVGELDKVEFLRPAEKRETMLVNLRNIFARMEPTKQDMHTLHGVVMAIAEGRKGPAKGGVLDGAQATRLRALLAGAGDRGAPSGKRKQFVRGLARLFGAIRPMPSASCGNR